MARFFVDRPVFAMVISIVIVLIGTLSLLTLPIAQYPEVIPPQVRVTATYRGANAQDVEKTVAAPIEQQLVGVDDLLYMSSSSSNDGALTIVLTFEVGIDLDLAVVKVQNKVKIAEPGLPEEVRREGVNVKKVSSSILQYIAVYSPDGRYDDLFLSNYVRINLLDRIGSIPGVGEASIPGEREYGMRIWLNPDKLAKLGMTAGDVRAAIAAQNRQNPAGAVGQPPGPGGVAFQYPVNAPGRLLEPAQFADIVVRAQGDGSLVRLRDIGRVELGAVDYKSYARRDGTTATYIGIFLTPGANAVATASGVQRFMAEAKKDFPAGIDYRVQYDTTRFVRASIREVVITLLIAIALVILVVFVFLQNWRATLIPLLTVPVSLIGTFAFFQVFGFTINMTTMFGLVLAIGIVVDDAIVVVEAVQHHMDHSGLSARDATIRAMEEVSGPVVAIAFILSAVFVPVAFLGGVTGQLYRNFALTVAVSVLLSTLSALTLTPALSAMLLRPTAGARGPLGLFYRGFNRAFDWSTRRYLAGVRVLIRRAAIALIALVAVYAVAFTLLKTLPTGFLPEEDQGAFFVTVRLPDAASLERTEAVTKRVEAILKSIPGVESVVTIGGFDLITGTNNTNVASVVGVLHEWDKRKAPHEQIGRIIGHAQREFAAIPGALIFAFNLPPILGLGSAGGFEMNIEDRAGRDLGALAAASGGLLAAAASEPALAGVTSPFRITAPQLTVSLDRDKTQTLGVPLGDVYDALQTFLGGLYVNDFNLYGRTWRVLLQGDSEFRRSPADVDRFYVRTSDGEMVPLTTLVSIRPTSGPEVIYRYNRYRTARLFGAVAPGVSAGQGNAVMERLATTTLPSGFGYEWTGTVYQQKRAEGREGMIFGLSSVLVLLLLAALYESWSIPFAVILAVPLGIFGALAGLWLGRHPYDVYTQIGIVTLIGLAAKNAVLIVEFAKLKHEEGRSLSEAALEAASLRLRPILMTSFAFIIGVVPLVVATGAGAGARRSLGLAVFSGMIAATLLAIFIVPVLYVVVAGLGERWSRQPRPRLIAQLPHVEKESEA